MSVNSAIVAKPKAKSKKPAEAVEVEVLPGPPTDLSADPDGHPDDPDRDSDPDAEEMVSTEVIDTEGQIIDFQDGEDEPEDEAETEAETTADDDADAAANEGDEQGDDESDDEDDEDDVLREVTVTDDDLQQIEAEITKRPAAAPAGTTALARRDPMAAYMAEVRRHPLLTREEEYELAVRWVEDNDQDAARKLVTSNLRLVVKIAHEYKRAYQNLLDLVQEGNVGLVKAVQKFDPYRGVKLSTYSGWWIRAYILKYILNNWRLVKIGTTQNQRKLFFNLRKQREALVAAGVDPTPERIAKELDVSTKEVVEMERRMAAPDMSLDAPLSDDGDGSRTRLDLIEDDYADPEGSADTKEFKTLLQDKLLAFGADLVGREEEVFRDRLLSEEPVTLQQLGDRWGVSRERARQIEKRLVLRLRGYLQSELGEAVQIALGHD